MVSVSLKKELNSIVLSHFPQARVMATIGVTRGLGDHNLKVCSSTLPIKPFLSCFPEVSTPSLQEAQAGFLPFIQPPSPAPHTSVLASLLPYLGTSV